MANIAGATLHEPMFLLLLAAAALYLVFGDLGEGLFLLAGASVSLGLVVFQEARSERALAALRALAEPLATVVRDGQTATVPARTIVPGDLLILGEGARVPADGVLVGGDALQVDESALTGESAAVMKCAVQGPPDLSANPAPGQAVSPFLFAGTMIVRGQGAAIAARTGASTRFGEIGAELAAAVEEPTLLQRQVCRLIGRLAVLAIAFCLTVAVAYGWLLGDWFQGALSGITLAISLLPEEMPMVLAVFMALGAWRLARHNVIVRRSSVIETLGAATLLCVDKTGTITENRMTLECLWRDGRFIDLTASAPREGAAQLIAAAQLASAVRAHDPMDLAIHAAAGPVERRPLRSYPVRPHFLAFVQVWQDAGRLLYAAKGAPETITSLCCMKDKEADRIKAAVSELAARGMRVLAVAEAPAPAGSSPDPDELAYSFVGLLGFADPVRPEVPPALREARRAGVSVAMITGDYPATAAAIAAAAGIDSSGGILAGADLLEGDGLARQIRDVRVFARVMPEQKVKLVEAFKKAGHVVAMTGDGINDAPALAAAHIGIAMGVRGTDVAREASDLILLDDRFASIVSGIALGRRIFANLRQAMTFITAIHVPIAGLALLPILLGLPPILYPMHVVLLELLIDPLCSLVFEVEPSEKDSMSKPPRPSSETLFGWPQILAAGLQGLILLAAVFGLYAWLIYSDASEGAARAAAFVALVSGNLALALVQTSVRPAELFAGHRIVFWAIAGVATVLVSLALTLPPLLDIFDFARPTGGQLILAVLTGLFGASMVPLMRRRRLRMA